ncbi:hypothetical protein [Streptomyces sp. NPDC020917]|uniref:hypothetical protein n=1 Tax=Streptomyces sp. NPDC020917 TaxID=3365102 RepID=UPI0037A431C7
MPAGRWGGDTAMGHLLDTDLKPGETLIANMAVQFPSGDYKRLMGFRSFRDFQGRDISAELPGWPPSRKPGEPPAKASVKGVLLASAWHGLNTFAFLLMLAGINADSLSAPSDPEELDDYPVLRADPGTLAAGAPWQLDPGRSKARPRVILHVTNQRLLFSDPRTDELLWEFGREDFKELTPGVIIRVTFVDDSWIRIILVKDKKALVPDREANYRTVTVKGKPTRIALSEDPHFKFVTVLKEFLAGSPTEST